MTLPCLFTKIHNVFKTHNNIILALDFDDTIYDWKNSGYDCDYVAELVKRCVKTLHAKVILFTCREGDHLNFAVEYCKEKEISLYGVNRNPDHPPTISKPFYNILLDDKACLSNVCDVLEELLSEYEND